MEELRQIIDMAYKALPREEFLDKFIELTDMVKDVFRVFESDIIEIKKRLEIIELQLKR